MPTSYTSLLGLALPVTGELSGTWGDTVNNYITSYVDASVAGTQTISTDGNVTLTVTNGTSLGSTSAQYMILNCTGARTAARTITVPASSRHYVVINGTTGGFAVNVVGAGPTTGVSVANGERCLIAWNGSDYVKVSTSTAGDVSAAANNAFTGANTFYNATGQTFGTATAAQDGIILAGRAGGTSTYRVTLTPTTLTGNRTLTMPDVTDTVATIGTAQTFTAAQTFRASNSVRAEAASTQDAVVLAGRAGGTSSYAVTLTPTTLSASRTLTLPDNTGTILTTGAAVTVGQGGTGITSGTSGGVPYYSSTSTIASSAALTANQFIVGGGAGAAPASSSLLTISAAVTTGNYVKAVGYADTVTALGNTGTAINIDVTSGGVFTATLTGNCTFTLRYPVSSGASSFTLILTNDATPSRTVAWAGGAFRFPGGAASLSRTTTANAVDIWVFFTPDGGTTWYGNIALKNMAA